MTPSVEGWATKAKEAPSPHDWPRWTPTQYLKVFQITQYFKFPKQFQYVCNRTLNIDWLKKHPFLVYSKSKNSLFCLPYALFSENRRSEFVKGDGFTKFFKIKEKIEVHVGSQHLDCIEKAVGLKNNFKAWKIHYHIQPTVYKLKMFLRTKKF